MLDDLLLTYLNRRQIPDLITILLRPKGNVTVPDRITVKSPGGGSELSARWRVVSLWDLDARPFLPNPGPGLAPWLTLARADEPVEKFLGSLRESIDTVADAGERANLLAISQILGGLRYDYDTLKALFGQEGAMIESPFLIERDRRMKLTSYREMIAKMLGEKFGAVPSDITNAISQVNAADELLSLGTRIVGVQTLDEFRSALPK